MICNFCKQSVYLVQSPSGTATALTVEEGAEILTYALVGNDVELAAYARLVADGKIFLVDHQGRRSCPARPRENRRF